MPPRCRRCTAIRSTGSWCIGAALTILTIDEDIAGYPGIATLW
jgi:hypothetical protein